MRLTLRTLLAYLDDILDPADAHELGRKIEDSEFAAGLVHRIRSVTRKLRLGAPKLSGKGMGLDPNTVAEYLDNTLPQDRVPDFEKVCLESDVHLAEVASCHQILTLVLGEPADVDPRLRERMRELLTDLQRPAPREPRPIAAPPLPEPPAVSGSPPTTRDIHAQPPVPHLVTADATAVDRRSLRSSLLIVGTLLATFVVALGLLVAVGPMDRSHPILGRFFPTDTPAPTRSDERLAQADTVVLPEPGSEIPRPADGTPRAAPKVDPPTVAMPEGERRVESGETGGTPVEGGGPPRTEGPKPKFPLPPDASDTSAPPDEKVPRETADADAMVGKIREPVKVMPDEEDEPDEVDEPPAEPEPLASYVSDMHVLAQWNPSTGLWLRVPTLDPILPAEPLLALPSYQPLLLLATGLRWTAVGPARWRHLEVPDESVPEIVLDYGRFIAVSSPTEGAKVVLRAGSRTLQLAWDAPDATVAIDLRRYRVPGRDPEEQPGLMWMDVISPHAAVRIEDLDRAWEPFSLPMGGMATMVGAQRPGVSPLSDMPSWLTAGATRPLDRLASPQLEPFLRSNRPLTVSLQEQASSRLTEVRVLATRSLALFDEYDAFLTGLNDRDLRIVWWTELFENLQLAIDRSPESASRVRVTCERLRGEEGQQLYRMLWGYSPEQLVEGEAESLVERLSSPAVDIRVVAFLTLRQITEKTNAYQPEVDVRRQRQSIANWQRDLRKGEIRHRTPPVVVEIGEK